MVAGGRMGKDDRKQNTFALLRYRYTMEQEKISLFFAVFGSVRQSLYLSGREVAISAVLTGASGRWAGEANSDDNKKAWSSFLFLFHDIDSCGGGINNTTE